MRHLQQEDRFAKSVTDEQIFTDVKDKKVGGNFFPGANWGISIITVVGWSVWLYNRYTWASLYVISKVCIDT